jgi:5-methylcytosine-specific restriction endonuclease McrA
MDTPDDTTPDERKLLCSKCGPEVGAQPVSMFYKQKGTTSGYRSACKACLTPQLQAWAQAHPEVRKRVRRESMARARVANPEKFRARGRANWAKASEETRLSHAIACRYYRQRHRERLLIAQRLKYAQNRQKNNVRSLQWAKDHPESGRANSRRRRALKKSAFVEKYTDKEIYQRDKGICQLCHVKINQRLKWPHPFSFSIDHIVPLSQGGEDAPRNVVSVHLRCNLSKCARAIPQQQRLF